MSEKKRKGSSHDARPAKRQQVSAGVKVHHVTGLDVAKPIVASSPGTDFPNVKFQCFSKTASNGVDGSAILLHSTEHRSITHTAREDDTSIDRYLKHYVAVFDPEVGKLQVTEAKRLTVRSAIRIAPQVREQDEEETPAVSNYSSRAALTAAFGTKKSKKAVQSATENRLLAHGNEDAEEPVSTAMLSGVKDEGDVDKEAVLAESLRNKPLPPANLRAAEIEEVYSVNTLIQPSPAQSTLAAMPIQTWIDRITAGKNVRARSRFVASRVGYLVQKIIATPEDSDRDFTQLQLLRYTQMLMDLHSYVKRLPRKKPIPPTEKWPEDAMSEETPMGLLRPIVKHFFPDRVPRDQPVTLLRTTIFALTLHISPPNKPTLNTKQLVTEPTDISMDLAIEAKEARKLYRELGCTMAPATEAELKDWGLERLFKAKAPEKALPKPMFVRLKFPLQFPQVSRGPSRGKR